MDFIGWSNSIFCFLHVVPDRELLLVLLNLGTYNEMEPGAQTGESWESDNPYRMLHDYNLFPCMEIMSR
jgi:hypothetical protein